MFGFKKPVVELFPFIDEGQLVIDSNLNGEPNSQVKTKLEVLFDDFMDYRRDRYGSNIDNRYRLEIIEMIGTLRNIAREMEKDIDATTH